jgi:hypothetical protein
VGGNIEGPYGSAYALHFMCTATVLDVIGSTTPLVSVVDGKELADFGVLTAEHAKHRDAVGPLKESIIRGFPDMIGLQAAIIRHHLEHVVPAGERFHVHVHRGARMGTEHISQLKQRLGAAADARLTFGYGYNRDELAPGGVQVPYLYYSISLMVGFDPRVPTGTTIVPSCYTDFTHPPVYKNVSIPHKPNLLLTTLPCGIDVQLGGTIAVLSGIFIPDDPHEVVTVVVDDN